MGKMRREIHKTEEEFDDNCPCAGSIWLFVNDIKDTDVKWFFDVGYSHYPEDVHWAIYKSYVTDEYKDYVLSIVAKKNENGEYVAKVHKKIDNLIK
ncbi:hypothetical protein [Paenibacillus odorifer]|uniref:hypothetical protein n=1 Tax=Paenibacillus odorifer TaxID=189426 RepID=UPI001180DDAF|nr:hypothetical protein [Paenibacillus odorifer]